LGWTDSIVNAARLFREGDFVKRALSLVVGWIAEAVESCVNRNELIVRHVIFFHREPIVTAIGSVGVEGRDVFVLVVVHHIPSSQSGPNRGLIFEIFYFLFFSSFFFLFFFGAYWVQ
jgi:hypothetical protein